MVETQSVEMEHSRVCKSSMILSVLDEIKTSFVPAATIDHGFAPCGKLVVIPGDKLIRCA